MNEINKHGIFKNTMANMTWVEIKQQADQNAIVLLPMGVIEEHGPHLCLATDIYSAHIYCLEVKQKLKENGVQAIIAPPFYWGICQAGNGFIGSFKIRPETAKSLPDVALGNNFEAWMFGGQLEILSPDGYLGSPASYDSVSIEQYIEDCANRISEGIMFKINSL